MISPLEARAHAAHSAGLAEPELSWPGVAEWRDTMIRHLDDAKQMQAYRDQGADVYKAPGRITGPQRVEAGGDTLEAGRIVVATGSDPKIPPIPGLAEAGYWTNREATTLSQLPARWKLYPGAADADLGFVVGDADLRDDRPAARAVPNQRSSVTAKTADRACTGQRAAPPPGHQLIAGIVPSPARTGG